MKDLEEVNNIRKAAITDAVFADLLKPIKPGIRELNISAMGWAMDRDWRSRRNRGN